MKSLKLLAVAAVLAVLGCDDSISPDAVEDCGSVIECHQESIQEAAERMSPNEEMVIVADPVAIRTLLTHPFTRAFYSPIQHIPLDHQWSLFVITSPDDLRLGSHSADHHQEHNPVCDIDDYYSTPRWLRGVRWERFGRCMSGWAEEHCGHETEAEYTQHFFYDQGDPDVEGDEHWDVHGYVTCIEPG